MQYLSKVNISIKTEDFSAEDITNAFEELRCDIIDFIDSDDSVYVIEIEDDYDIGSVQDLFNILLPLSENLTGSTFNVKGTLFSQEDNEYCDFEMEISEDIARYRETDWYVDDVIDDDLTYEEYEEEGYNNIDEEDFQTYSHKKNKNGSRKVSTKGKFHRWKSLN